MQKCEFLTCKKQRKNFISNLSDRTEHVEHFYNTLFQEKIGSSWRTRKVAQMQLGGILKYNRLYRASVNRVGSENEEWYALAYPLYSNSSLKKNPGV